MSASVGSLPARLILVDNASRDGVEQWRNYFKDTIVLQNLGRLGYAANLNRILDASEARYILLLNTDMYFDPKEKCLQRMVQFMDQHPSCGLAGCRILHPDGSDAFAARRFQTPALIAARRLTFLQNLGLKHWVDKTIRQYFYADRKLSDAWQCDWVSGCFMMVRRAAMAQVGYFDECYGKYFEDVDICLRMSQFGWQVLYNGAVSCYHIEQRASRWLFSPDAWTHLRAYSKWIRKWGLKPWENISGLPAQRRAA